MHLTIFKIEHWSCYLHYCFVYCTNPFRSLCLLSSHHIRCRAPQFIGVGHCHLGQYSVCGEACVCEKINYGNVYNFKRVYYIYRFSWQYSHWFFLNANDVANGKTMILEEKNSIYLCDKMDNSFLNPFLI